MNIIPTIDIKKGKVVKAHKGDRNNYTPINELDGFSSNPLIFVKEIIKIFRPSIIYIADIDSFTSKINNIDLIRKIATENKNSIFWVDTGGNKDKRLNRKNIVPILCSENCHSIKNINYVYKDYIHSYDYKDKFLGSESFKKLDSIYKNRVIFMNISDVGNEKGPDYKYIRSMIKKNNNEYYVGGGIKSMFDINKLKLMGINGVLVSSLLFKKHKNSFLIKKRASI